MFTSKSASALCIAFVSLAAGCSSLPHSDAAMRSGLSGSTLGLDVPPERHPSFKTCNRWLADHSNVSSKDTGIAFRPEARDETCGGDDPKLGSLNLSLQRDHVVGPTPQAPESVAGGEPAPRAHEGVPDPENPEVPVASTGLEGPSSPSQTEDGPKSPGKPEAPGQAKDRSAKTSLKDRFDAGRGNGSEGGDPGNSQEHNQGDG